MATFSMDLLSGRNSTGSKADAISGPYKGKGKGYCVDMVLAGMLLDKFNGKPPKYTVEAFDKLLLSWFPEGTTIQSGSKYIAYFRQCTNNQGPLKRIKVKDGLIRYVVRKHVCGQFDAFVKAHAIPVDLTKPKGAKCKTGAELFLNHTQWTLSFKDAK